jgi:hypothetical protein
MLPEAHHLIALQVEERSDEVAVDRVRVEFDELKLQQLALVQPWL